MNSAVTAESHSLTVDYTVSDAPAGLPITFGVYRSADAQLSPDDQLVASATVAQAVNGEHQVTVSPPGGLPINPEHPDILVVADPNAAIAESSRADNVAVIHTHSIAVVTHGGNQSKGDARLGPLWVREMARALEDQGYDDVIQYNWVLASRHPGDAARQGPRVASLVTQAASAFPAGDLVDVHFIGHSEGAIVNSLAAQRLAANAPANLQAGYVQMTMLDPHAANINARGPQYSVSHGTLGTIAKQTIDAFQRKAHDPLPFVPANVDDADVYFQRTPASQAQSNHGWYNLWGQVPVFGQAYYYNITGKGLSHSGKFAVYDWYRLNVVPSLGDGAAYFDTNALTAAQEPLDSTRQVSYAGHSAPGAVIRLFAGPAQTHDLAMVGRAVAGQDGSWSLITRPLASMNYRVVATATVPAGPSGRGPHMVPTTWLPRLTVGR